MLIALNPDPMKLIACRERNKRCIQMLVDASYFCFNTGNDMREVGHGGVFDVLKALIHSFV